MQRTVTMEQGGPALEQWIHAVSRGETVLITRGGRTVAALVSPPAARAGDRIAAAGLDPGLAGLFARADTEEILRFLGEG